MKLLTREWIEKAEGDFATASREMRARKSPNYDAACFHARLCFRSLCCLPGLFFCPCCQPTGTA
jgi:hypothetical protein